MFLRGDQTFDRAQSQSSRSESNIDIGYEASLSIDDGRWQHQKQPIRDECPLLESGGASIITLSTLFLSPVNRQVSRNG